MASSCYKRKTTCLFCPTIVLLGETEEKEVGRDPGAERARSKLLKILCHQLQVSREDFDVPENCSKAAFPFCNNCEWLVTGISRENEVMQRAKAKIERRVSALEKIVVDGEILRDNLPDVSSSFCFMENQKCTKLKELILERYKSKLATKYQVPLNASSAANTGTGTASSQPINSGSHKNDEEEDLRSGWNVLANNPPREVHNVVDVRVKNELQPQEAENVAVNIDPMDFGVCGQPPEDLECGSLHRLSMFQQCYEECQGTGHEEDDQTFSQDSQFNDVNCTLSCPPLSPDTVAVKGTTAISNDAASLIQIKQEASNSAQDNQMEEDDDSDHDSIFELAVTRRRVLFEGVEIYKATQHGSSSRNKSEYLQCSLCPYTLELPKGSKYKIRKAKTALYIQMKKHIISAHKGTRDVKLWNNKKLREHKNKNPDDKRNNTLQCDICGRTITGNLSDLKQHKFHHKNDEERKAALEAKEVGSNDGRFLSDKGKAVADPTPKRKRNRESKAKKQDSKKVKETKEDSLSSTMKRSLNDPEINIKSKSASCPSATIQQGSSRSTSNRRSLRLKMKTSDSDPTKGSASGNKTSGEILQRSQNGSMPTTYARTFHTTRS